MSVTPRTGRCQHCAQIRPLFHHEGELHFWGYYPGDGAWLCARDHGAREIAIENDEAFHINRRIQPFPDAEDEPIREGAAATQHAEGGGA